VRPPLGRLAAERPSFDARQRRALDPARRAHDAPPALLTLDWAATPRGEYGMPVPRITKEDLKQRIESEDASTHPSILDVRLKYPYEHSTVRLPGAIRMMPGAIDETQLPRDREIVAYDSDPNEVTSSSVAVQLIHRGFRVSVLKGGIAEWAGASFPVETKSAPKPAPPPVKA
jgi:rhodanese-related sulfurtransferase